MGKLLREAFSLIRVHPWLSVFITFKPSDAEASAGAGQGEEGWTRMNETCSLDPDFDEGVTPEIAQIAPGKKIEALIE